METRSASIVVVGDLQLARAVARLVPTASVVDAELDPDLREPATAVPVIRRRMEGGSTPGAVVCDARPGFSVLAGLAGFPAHRCLVVGTESPFPPGTVRSMVEAVGMTYVPQLDSLPTVMAGRGPGPPAGGRARGRVNGLERDAQDAEAGEDGWSVGGGGTGSPGEGGPRPESFSWAAMTPVPVPPDPPADAAPAGPGRVVEAGSGPSTAVAGRPDPERATDRIGLPGYAPADPLRPLRPRAR